MKNNTAGSKVAFNFRLTPAGKMLLVRLGEHMGLTRSGVLETAIRVLAKEQGLAGGMFTREEVEEKWTTFLEEDEVARSAELEKKRSEAMEQTSEKEG